MITKKQFDLLFDDNNVEISIVQSTELYEGEEKAPEVLLKIEYDYGNIIEIYNVLPSEIRCFAKNLKKIAKKLEKLDDDKNK